MFESGEGALAFLRFFHFLRTPLQIILTYENGKRF